MSALIGHGFRRRQENVPFRYEDIQPVGLFEDGFAVDPLMAVTERLNTQGFCQRNSELVEIASKWSVAGVF